jgi:hydroxyacylglutathione hydrolase
MHVRQFRYASDNLGYLVHEAQEAVAIDGGAVEEMLAFSRARGLTIRFTVNTHAHSDHTTGNGEIIGRTGAAFIDCRGLAHGAAIPLGRERLMVYKTPGHTSDSVTFQADGALITGDTLFNGTVGNCFSGDLKSFLASILFLMAFPAETLIYAGHDYVRESMAVARSLEPENPEIDRYLAKYHPFPVVSTLEDELKVNPYLRFNAPAVVRILEAHGLPVETEYDRWHSIMSLG